MKLPYAPAISSGVEQRKWNQRALNTSALRAYYGTVALLPLLLLNRPNALLS